jgi:hypothetical protein
MEVDAIVGYGYDNNKTAHMRQENSRPILQAAKLTTEISLRIQICWSLSWSFGGPFS